jgi:hypothetical protein
LPVAALNVQDEEESPPSSLSSAAHFDAVTIAARERTIVTQWQTIAAQEQTIATQHRIIATRQQDEQMAIIKRIIAVQLETIDSLQQVIVARAGLTFCLICFKSARDTALNCGHVLCAGCASRIIACPCCRVPITKRRRIFL